MINYILNKCYKFLIKPILFSFDAEEVHHQAINIGHKLSNIRLAQLLFKYLFYINSKSLKTELFGLKFHSPVGLSAGFDYEGLITGITPYIGFGFESAGTVTYNQYEGNEKPRLARLPKSKSLLVNKGFKSSGVKNMVNNLTFVNGFNLGLSIGATNSPECATPDAQIEDIINTFKYVKAHPVYKKLAYLELNISCPNVKGAGTLANEYNLYSILSKLKELNLNKSLLVKFPIEIEHSYARKLVQIMIDLNVDGVIIGNLAKNRDNPLLDTNELDNVGKGNFSGKPTWDLSNDLISVIYKDFGKEIKIIGVGGIFTAEDAYEKIKRGASLVQLITGMIYQGPQLISEINSGLVRLMKQDGFENINDAVGSHYN
jgi:dihydroorotate dehydrogenase